MCVCSPQPLPFPLGLARADTSVEWAQEKKKRSIELIQSLVILGEA